MAIERFTNKTVLVTGAASGLGAEAVRQFAAEGAAVLATDVDAAGLDALQTQVRAAGGAIATLVGDVADPITAARCVAAAQDQFGHLHVLFNNAGIDPIEAGRAGETRDAVWDRVMAVNLRGAFLFARAAIGAMAGSGGGAMVHTASISGIRPTPLEAAYSVSKAALIQLSRSIALDHAAEGIRSNCICPGFLESVMRDRSGALDAAALADRSRLAASIVPLGREGRYAEVARSVLFLASDDAAYITGASLLVDGGMTLA